MNRNETAFDLAQFSNLDALFCVSDKTIDCFGKLLLSTVCSGSSFSRLTVFVKDVVYSHIKRHLNVPDLKAAFSVFNFVVSYCVINNSAIMPSLHAFSFVENQTNSSSNL